MISGAGSSSVTSGMYITASQTTSVTPSRIRVSCNPVPVKTVNGQDSLLGLPDTKTGRDKICTRREVRWGELDH